MSWVEGNAERLPFSDESMDAYTIAFGIRNVTDKDAALRDAYRVRALRRDNGWRESGESISNGSIPSHPIPPSPGSTAMLHHAPSSSSSLAAS